MYDAIIVGARVAGAPTALLLARAGHKVLLVDRATFPSDTLSTHYIHQPGMAALKRWGLLDRVMATGCPAITRATMDLGPFALTGYGITDAFRDAGLSGQQTVEAALAGYEARRNEVAMPIYEFILGLATLHAPPEMQALLFALQGNDAAIRDMWGVIDGTVHPAAFFAPENIGRIMAAASKAA